MFRRKLRAVFSEETFVIYDCVLSCFKWRLFHIAKLISEECTHPTFFQDFFLWSTDKMFKLLFSFKTVFDHFSDGWVALQNVDAIWTTNDGRTPKPETTPWAKGHPFLDYNECTAINRNTLI